MRYACSVEGHTDTAALEVSSFTYGPRTLPGTGGPVDTAAVRCWCGWRMWPMVRGVAPKLPRLSAMGEERSA